jgi:hypothetical protein
MKVVLVVSVVVIALLTVREFAHVSEVNGAVGAKVDAAMLRAYK